MVSKSLITVTVYVKFFLRICRLEICIPFHISLIQFNQYFTSSFNTVFKKVVYTNSEQIPVASRSKAWVSGRSHAGAAGSNLAGSMDIYLW